MGHIRILLLGVSFMVYMSYQIPRPHGTYTHTSIRGFIRVYISYNLKSPGPMEHIRILLVGVSFRVYRSYKIRSGQKVDKIEKVEMAETREVRRGFTFLTDLSKNSS